MWTNDRVTNWLTTLGILDTNISLDQSGLHGAVLALDADMDTPTLATILQIPNSNIEARLVLVLPIYKKKSLLIILKLFIIGSFHDNKKYAFFNNEDDGNNSNSNKGKINYKEKDDK